MTRERNHVSEFIAWPGWETFKVSASLSILFFIIFYGLYALTDTLTGLHTYRVRIDFFWEQDIPLMPAMSIFYLSISPLLVLSIFIIRDIPSFKAFFQVLVLETLIAVIFFLLIPVESHSIEQEVKSIFTVVYLFADVVNLSYNELPSLHVAFTFTACLVYNRRAKNIEWKVILAIWAALIFLSTIVTHQHEVLGALAGLPLAWLCLKMKGRSLISIGNDEDESKIP